MERKLSKNSNVLVEEEIRPERLKLSQAPLLAEDIKWLISQRNKFVKVPCPACGSKKERELFRKLGLRYCICYGCQTIYVNPRPSPKVLEEYYATSKNYNFWNKYIFPASEKARRIKIFRPRAERLVELCRKYGSRREVLLEVGAGFGTFCEEIMGKRFFKRVIAIEPTPDLACTCKSKGIDVIALPVEQVKFGGIKADVVASFEVIEHLFNASDFIKKCAGLISKGGLLILTCPNSKGFDLATLGKASESFDHEHLNYFHPESLSSCIREHGFDIIEVSTPGKLDAELVRKAALEGRIDLSDRPLLNYILIKHWNELGSDFQQFLVDNGLSSHMWIVGRKR